MKYAISVLILIYAAPLFGSEMNIDPVKIDFVKAVRTAEKIIIDGLLDETVWKNQYCIDKFVQREPIEYDSPSEPTEVRVAYDDEAIYIAARMYDSAPDSIIARLGRRDSWPSSDQFLVFVDSYHDRSSGFYFSINAAGTQADGILLNDDWDDNSWDGIWKGCANIDDKGWTAELKIPYSQLRFNKEEHYVWGINFKRVIQRKNETNYLTFTPKDGSGFVSRFVDLIGIENISPPKHIEFQPYLRTKAEYTNPDRGDPFDDGTNYDPGVGIDMKIGLGNAITLDATINPDFGQVEVDPAVVNLSDVETFYQEKRPFFLEGVSIFNFGVGGSNNYLDLNWPGMDAFYSRRIGRSPSGSLPDYDYASVPDGTRILGAAKLSGKMGKKWNFGMIHALTAAEKATIQYEGTTSTLEVEPAAYYGILRGQRDFNQRAQGLGFISTLTQRQLSAHVPPTDFNDKAFTFGLDGWTFLDNDRIWVVSGYSGLSHVTGSSERMLELQQNSQHYYQRPDADHVSVDSAANSLTGYVTRLSLNKQKGRVFFNSAFGFISPGFDLNDVGFIRYADVINWHIACGYRWTKPTNRYREFMFATALFQTYDCGLNKTWDGILQYFNVIFLNYYDLECSFAYNPSSYSTRSTRGGPMMKNKPGWEANLLMHSDNRKKWVFEMETFGYVSNSGSWFRGVRFGLEYKPASNMSISVSPLYEYNHDDTQWIDNFEDPTANETYDHRYVFSQLDQHTFAASIRMDLIFNPTMSFQVYAQPLICSGQYFDFKELSTPGSYKFNHYGQDDNSVISIYDNEYYIDPDGEGLANSISFSNPDFNYKSLRGNAVFRWEYKPGSVLYLVWTQSRAESEEIGDFKFRRSLSRMLNTVADNIFMLKLNYYLNL
ncbi:carbohydrate binding family 9 domain-containing protein [candidate division KSB1 bacterium]|nr:carbohydrate binding family 9 domain-containing protein [candidate division KSB1 bacterium]